MGNHSISDFAISYPCAQMDQISNPHLICQVPTMHLVPTATDPRDGHIHVHEIFLLFDYFRQFNSIIARSREETNKGSQQSLSKRLDYPAVVYRGAVLAFCRCCHPTGRWLAALKAEKHGLIEESLTGAVVKGMNDSQG